MLFGWLTTLFFDKIEVTYEAARANGFAHWPNRILNPEAEDIYDEDFEVVWRLVDVATDLPGFKHAYHNGSVFQAFFKRLLLQIHVDGGYTDQTAKCVVSGTADGTRSDAGAG